MLPTFTYIVLLGFLGSYQMLQATPACELVSPIGIWSWGFQRLRFPAGCFGRSDFSGNYTVVPEHPGLALVSSTRVFSAK